MWVFQKTWLGNLKINKSIIKMIVSINDLVALSVNLLRASNNKDDNMLL